MNEYGILFVAALELVLVLYSQKEKWLSSQVSTNHWDFNLLSVRIASGEKKTIYLLFKPQWCVYRIFRKCCCGKVVATVQESIVGEEHSAKQSKSPWLKGQG